MLGSGGGTGDFTELPDPRGVVGMGGGGGNCTEESSFSGRGGGVRPAADVFLGSEGTFASFIGRGGACPLEDLTGRGACPLGGSLFSFSGSGGMTFGLNWGISSYSYTFLWDRFCVDPPSWDPPEAF